MEYTLDSGGGPQTPPDAPPPSVQPSLASPCRPKPSALPIDKPTAIHNSNVANVLSSEKARSSPEPNCSICLGKLENKSFTNGCLHMFCFTCLLQWSKIKAECPLCKQSFKSIIYNVRSMQEYDEYHVTAPETFTPIAYQMPYHDFLSTIQLQALSNRHHQISIPFRYSTTMSTRRIDSRVYTRVENSWVLPTQHSRPWNRASRRIATNDFRSSVYTRDMWAVPPSDLLERVRDCSPGFYRLNPAQVHRLVPWLSRELGVLLANNKAPLVLDLIIRTVTQYEISSSEFRRLLRLHLGQRVDHFIHEFQSFASSHFDLIGYDQAVTYIPNPNPVSHSPIDLVNDGNSSSDSDVMFVPYDEPAAGPSGVNSGRAAAGPSSQSASISTVPVNHADEDSDDCLIVKCVKPRHERTPEIIELSSEDEHVNIGQGQAADYLEEFPVITDFELDSEELHNATVLLLESNDFDSSTASLTSDSKTSSSEYRPNFPSKRRAPKKEVDSKKKFSSKSSAAKKDGSKKGKSVCKKCIKHKSRSGSCTKGKGKHSKCEKCNKPPVATDTRSTTEEQTRHSQISLSKRARRDESSTDSFSETDSKSLISRLRVINRTKRPNRRRFPSFNDDDDEPIASTSSMAGPSRRQTRQRFRDVPHASNWSAKHLWSTDDDEPITKAPKQKRTKSRSNVEPSRKRSRHKKKTLTFEDSESTTKTHRSAKKRSGTNSRKRRTEACANLQTIPSSTRDGLDIGNPPRAVNYRDQDSSVDSVANIHNSSSELNSHSRSAPIYGSNLSTATDDRVLTSNNLYQKPTKTRVTTDMRDGNVTIQLETTSTSSREDIDHCSSNEPLRLRSERSPFNDLNHWLPSGSSTFVASSPNSSITLGNEVEDLAPMPTFPTFANNPYCGASASLNPEDIADASHLMPSTSRSVQNEIGFQCNNGCSVLKPTKSTDVCDGAWKDTLTGRSSVDSPGQSAPSYSDTWTIMKPLNGGECSDDSSSDSVDLEDNRPRLKSIVITRSNNQRTCRERSSTPDRHSSDRHSSDRHSSDRHSSDRHSSDRHSSDRHSSDRHSSHSSRNSHTYKNHSTEAQLYSGESSCEYKAASYKKRFTDSDRSSSSGNL